MNMNIIDKMSKPIKHSQELADLIKSIVVGIRTFANGYIDEITVDLVNGEANVAYAGDEDFGDALAAEIERAFPGASASNDGDEIAVDLPNDAPWAAAEIRSPEESALPSTSLGVHASLAEARAEARAALRRRLEDRGGNGFSAETPAAEILAELRAIDPNAQLRDDGDGEFFAEFDGDEFVARKVELPWA